MFSSSFSRRFLFLFLFGIHPLYHNCQISKSNIGNEYYHLTSRNGLTKDFITSLVKDKSGNLWIGTDEGLNRYDGKHMETYRYDSTNPKSISFNHIQSLLCGHDGLLWVASKDQGVSVYNPLNQRFKRYIFKHKTRDGIKPLDDIYHIYEDSRNLIWICTWGSGLYSFDPATRKLIEFNDSYLKTGSWKSKNITSIIEDKTGNFWIGAWANGPNNLTGLYYMNSKEKSLKSLIELMNEKKITSIPKDISVTKFVHALYLDDQNNLWIGGYLGLIKLNLNDNRISNFSFDSKESNKRINTKVVKSISQEKNKLLVGTLGGGLNVLDIETQKFDYHTFSVSNPNGINCKDISGIYQDRDGVNYIATYGGGVNIPTYHNQVIHFDHSENLNLTQSNNIVDISAIAYLDSFNFLIGSSTGLIKYNSKSNESVKLSEETQLGVTAISKLDHANQYIICYKNGIAIYNSQTNRSTKIPATGIDLNSITQVERWSQDSLLYIQEFAGVKLHDLKSKTIVQLPIKEEGVGFYYSVKKLDDEHILIGYKNGIIQYHLPSQKIQHLYGKESKTLLEDGAYTVNDIDIRSKSEVWFVANEGLGLLNTLNKKYSIYKNVYRGKSIIYNGIFQDSKNNIWLKSNYNIDYFDIKKNKFRRIENSLIENAHQTKGDFSYNLNQLMLGSSDGIYTINLDKFYDSLNYKPIHLTKIHVYNEKNITDTSIQVLKLLNLDYNQNSFSLEVSNFHLSQNQEFEIVYRLDNYDSTWRYLDPDYTIRYSNLPAGKYQLEIKYKHLENRNIRNRVLNICIDKPFWMKWWFILLTITGFSLLTLSYEKWKTRSLKAKNEELEKSVTERTKELSVEKSKTENLLHNILPKDVASELKETGQSKARYIENATVIFTDFINFTGISSKLDPQMLVDLLDEYYKAFDEIMERNGIEKIKTIGDAYLAAGGLTPSDINHPENALNAAIEILNYIRTVNRTFEIRIGIHTGPIVAGIVGSKKFAFDIWGDTVNVAARMEQNCETMRINVSQSTYLLTMDKFRFQNRGEIEVKNKGKMTMYYLESRR